MSFTLRNLSVLAYANGFTLWHYKAGRDGLEAVDRRNFFAEANDLLAAGDIVMATGDAGARIGAICRDHDGLNLVAMC